MVELISETVFHFVQIFRSPEIGWDQDYDLPASVSKNSKQYKIHFSEELFKAGCMSH